MNALPPPPPIEETRLVLQKWLQWIMYKPPGEAVSGEFDLTDFEQPKNEDE